MSQTHKFIGYFPCRLPLMQTQRLAHTRMQNEYRPSSSGRAMHYS